MLLHVMQDHRALPVAATAADSNELENSIQQLELQSQSANESSSSGHEAAGTSTNTSDAGVSQSRASSSIRVAKFHKVLNEALVRRQQSSYTVEDTDWDKSPARATIP